MDFDVLILKCLYCFFLVEGLKVKPGVVDLDIVDDGVVDAVVHV
jgi:hypothetical protein